jgi:serine protease
VSPAWTDSFDITVGTSFASPLVAGVAALMLSERPELTPAQLREALQSTARPFPTTGADNGDDPTPVPSCTRVDLAGDSGQCYCTTGLCGAGMVDAAAAVAAVSGW